MCNEQRASTKELYELIDLVYGGMPPEPQYFQLLPLHIPGPGRKNTYQITVGSEDARFSFIMELTRPETQSPSPVVLTGDGCYNNMNDAVVEEILCRGMIAAKFNRTVLAADIKGGERNHGVYTLYPKLSFGAISAWAWGYLRCVDALVRLDFVDVSQIAITGHSRGGKTALLAGAADERIAFVQANNSGAGGTASWRHHMKDDSPHAKPNARSERLDDLLRSFPFWFGPNLPQYAGREEELPFDQFLLEAAIAPRKMLDTQGLADIWANPEGAMKTHLAAREVYAQYGAEDNLRILFREGGHGHGFADYCALLDFMQGILADEAVWRRVDKPAAQTVE